MDAMRLFFMIKKFKKKYNNTLLIVFVMLSVLLLINLFFPISTPFKSLTISFTAPIQRAMLTTGNNMFPKISVFQNTEVIKEEIELLRRENERLLSMTTRIKILEEENTALRRLLGIQKEEDNIEIAEVLGREMGSHHVLINHNNKINIDSPVTTPEGVLVGFVIETHNNISKVRLLTSKESALEAKIINENYPIGVLKGNDKRGLYIETLPKNKDVKKGDLVVGQSYNGINLNDIYIGRVINITDHDVDPFLSANIYQGIDLRYINYLFIQNK